MFTNVSYHHATQKYGTKRAKDEWSEDLLYIYEGVSGYAAVTRGEDILWLNPAGSCSVAPVSSYEVDTCLKVAPSQLVVAITQTSLEDIT